MCYSETYSWWNYSQKPIYRERLRDEGDADGEGGEREEHEDLTDEVGTPDPN